MLAQGDGIGNPRQVSTTSSSDAPQGAGTSPKAPPSSKAQVQTCPDRLPDIILSDVSLIIEVVGRGQSLAGKPHAEDRGILSRSRGQHQERGSGRVDERRGPVNVAVTDLPTPSGAQLQPPTFSVGFTAKTWAGLRAERIGAGTIYHLAMERGWKPDPALVLDGAAPCDAVHPAAGLLAKVQVSDPGPMPPAPQPSFELRVPEGILAEMVEYMVSTARRPQPLLSLGASLCALGALMGRKYRTETNLRSNLYIVGIADSGSGKNHAREIINELFFEAGLAQHLGGNKIASGAGLLTALHRQPALLLQIDEFGMFLAAAADRKRSPRHITEILDNMTELYTAAGSVFLGAEYANHDGRNERRDITQPCLCVYGTTTPLHFWNALQSANVVDGSLARFIILPTEEDYPEEARGAVSARPRRGSSSG